MEPLQHLLFALLLIGMPLWDRYETRLLRTSGDPAVKLRSYRRTVAALWGIAVVTLLASHDPLALFTFPPLDMQAFWGMESMEGMEAILIGLGIGVLLPVLLPLVSPKMRELAAKPLQSIAFFLPNTGQERRWWVALSVTAGICEEIAYRGFLLAYLLANAPWLGSLGIIAVACVMFGLVHGYQGIMGMVMTAALAFAMTLLFWVTGSLLWPILVHAIIDLRVLLVWKPGRVEAGAAR